MYFEQFYLACLSHASYMIGSEGVAAVVDPQRDVGLYLEEARKHDLRIEHVVETHLHADFVSGHQELAGRTGARVYVGARANAQFPHVPVHDGDEVRFGKCRLEFIETPGHTLESVSILVTDLERSPEPFAVLTGDTLFIGDVGRPDLSPDHTPQQLAGLLHGSLQKLLKLPDATEVYPAHGAGSLCGRSMSAERRSTIGKERESNYALRAGSREEFVRLLTSELPERPGYFALDAEINRRGAPPLEALPPLAALSPGAFAEKQRAGAVVLDTRPAPEFGAAHLPGSFHIALAGQFALWAGTVIGLERDILLVAEEPARVEESRVRLARVGIDRVVGYLEGGLASWVAEGRAVEQVPQVPPLDVKRALEERAGEIQLVDVRRPSEWREGHVEGAVHKPLDRLRGSLGGLDPARPVAVYCKSGYRSSISSSILQAAGFKEVFNITGGFDAWKASHLPYVE